MSIAQLEQQVSSLEERVEELRAQLTRSADQAATTDTAKAAPGEDDIIPGTEYIVVLAEPPAKEITLRGRIVSIEHGPQELGLSDAEWASLGLKKEDEQSRLVRRESRWT
jgi:hypothetical protein